MTRRNGRNVEALLSRIEDAIGLSRSELVSGAKQDEHRTAASVGETNELLECFRRIAGARDRDVLLSLARSLARDHDS